MFPCVVRMVPKRVFEFEVPVPIEDVWTFHSSAEALRVLTPPGTRVELVGPTDVVSGALHTLVLHRGFLGLVWKARISEVEPPHGFRDTAEKSPFRSWTHRHDFLSLGSGRTMVRDTVEYEPPGWALGPLLDRVLFGPMVVRMFAHRRSATQKFFAQQPRATMG